MLDLILGKAITYFDLNNKPKIKLAAGWSWVFNKKFFTDFKGTEI